MNIMRTFILVGIAIGLSSSPASAAGQYYTVDFPASKEPAGLQLAVTYNLWIPDGVETLCGVIVHQHGCGTGACEGGETAANDLHWQALAKKWDCALLGPRYHQAEMQNCRLWCDPRNGSAKTFLKSLDDFADKSKHPELQTIPWCLWGHSGGAFWASLMQTMYPDRIVAIWHRSGGAIDAWSKDQIPRPEFPPAAFTIPTMCNPGIKERDDPRMKGAWIAATGLFQVYRRQGAPIIFAADPRSSHECADSRYLAIPFFDACLELRLPEKSANSQALRLVDMTKAWLVNYDGGEPVPAEKYEGFVHEAIWLPNEKFAKLWAEYVKVGSTSDDTPPPVPTNVKLTAKPGGGIEVTWECEADFESGLKCFLIRRDGKPLAQVPEKPVGKYGRPLFQSMNYHDTPEKPLPEMKFVDQSAKPGESHTYEVISVNSVGLESEAASTK